MNHNTADTTQLEPYNPGSMLYFYGILSIFFCLPLAPICFYFGHRADVEYDRMSDSEKREYQKNNR